MDEFGSVVQLSGTVVDTDGQGGADVAVYASAKSGYVAHDVESGKELWTRRFSATLDLLADPIGDKWDAY